MKQWLDGEPAPIVLDIEASGFGRGSYPIEVGFVDHSNERYCSLIRPLPDWTHWSADAERTHGISRQELLSQGRSPRDVVLELNEQLRGCQVYSDCWVVDHPWLLRLFFAVNIEPSFQLSPIELIMTEAQVEIWDEVHQQVMAKSTLQRHRASADAWIIQQTWMQTRLLLQQETPSNTSLKRTNSKHTG